jgi:hypothetical protein
MISTDETKKLLERAVKKQWGSAIDLRGAVWSNREEYR